MPEDLDVNKPWKLISTERAFSTPWFDIQKKLFELPNGAKPTFYIHDTHDSVMCVCVTSDNKILIERQYRPAINRVSVDYPAGKLEDSDTSMEEAMLRELKEETGYKTTSFKKLAVIDKDPGFSSTRMHIFLARGIIPGKDDQEETESISSALVSPSQLMDLILSGEMACSYCISATFYVFQELGWMNIALPS